MSAHVLAVVGVDKSDRIVCQAQGCGHGVYRRIHIVSHDNGELGVFGSDCFERMFGQVFSKLPRYGGREARELTAEERQLLADNTERLIAKFEEERQALLK